MAQQGSIALPSDDTSNREPWWKKVQNWFQVKLEGEQAPLLADENSPRRSRRYNTRLVIAALVFLIALIVFIVLGVVWYNTDGNRIEYI